MYQHLMIDLETLGTVPGCVIVQIGLAAFNVDDDKMTAEKINVDVQSCIDAGLHIDASTLRWWMEQSAEARKSVFGSGGGLELPRAIEVADNFYLTHVDGGKVWGHGAGFDEPILRAAHHALGFEDAWHHGLLRDTRTLADIVPHVERVEPKLAHDAESDAIAQAQWVRAMLREVRALTTKGNR